LLPTGSAEPVALLSVTTTTKSEKMPVNNHDNDDAAGLLAEHQAANRATVMDSSTCDKSYDYEYNKFAEWVAEQPELGTAEAPFITRRNVDHYFTRQVALRTVEPNGIGRVANALDWYAKNRETIGANPDFECDAKGTTIVAAALKAQKACYITYGGNGGLSDPHSGLKDILPVSSKILFMEHIYRERNDWGPASVNFTWGQNGAVRGHSNRKMVFCDLNLSHGFGPESVGPLSRALLLIHQRGKVHKDNHITDKQVCTWRHRDYRLCSNLATALHVIYEITRMNDISFLHPNKKEERAPWWDIPLINWDNYNGEFDCVKCCFVRGALCRARTPLTYRVLLQWRRLPQRRYTKQPVLRARKLPITVPRPYKWLGLWACGPIKLTR
jgi:hypothetical protein